MQVNPKGKEIGEERGLRGGSWNSLYEYSVSLRGVEYAETADTDIGFRVVMGVKQDASKS